jgi:hypothetical protein
LVSFSKDSLEQIRKTYKALVSTEQLVIPGQVAREFAVNRARKLGELFQQLNRKAKTPPMRRGNYPLLAAVEAYQTAVELEAAIDKLLVEYSSLMERVLEHVKGWTWSDPVSLLYSDLFTPAVVFDPDLESKFVTSELERRQQHGIPPGYKDGGKDINSAGDLLIWLTMLELGRSRRRSVIFVSGEVKSDWFHRSEGLALYPRHELVDEFRRCSEGQSFHIIQFSQLLTLYGASDSVVAEVQREEQQANVVAEVTSGPFHSPLMVTITVNTTGDKERDKRRLRRVHGILTSYPGIDQFQFKIFDYDQKMHVMNFMNDRTGFCPDLERLLQELLGPGTVITRPLGQASDYVPPPWSDDELEVPF